MKKGVLAFAGMIVVAIILLVMMVKIRGCVHYNMYYKKHVQPSIEKVEDRIEGLELRIEALEKK